MPLKNGLNSVEGGVSFLYPAVTSAAENPFNQNSFLVNCFPGQMLHVQINVVVNFRQIWGGQRQVAS